MKLIKISELKRLAEYYDGTFKNDLLPAIEFEGYGIEATEIDKEGNCFGFKFYGHSSKQADVIDLWNELTEEQTAEKLLTIELAKSLIDKKVAVAYRSSSGYEQLMSIEITGIEASNEKAIGQSTTHYLVFIEDGQKASYIYEWQGIFRVSGGAYKLYLKKIIE